MEESNYELPKPFAEFDPKQVNLNTYSIGEPFNIPKEYCKSATSPYMNFNHKLDMGEIRLVYYDAYKPISIEKLFYDGAKILESSNNKTFIVYQESQDPTGVIISSWEYICEPISIEFGELDYSSNELSTIAITVRIKKGEKTL